MTATLTAMGLELHGDATEVVADYTAGGNLRFVQYLINDPETDAPGYLLTRYGEADCYALELLRVADRDGVVPVDAMLTDRFASDMDDPDVFTYGGDVMIWVDGLAYVGREPSTTVLACGNHVDDEADYVARLLGGQ